jgi:glycosyltransferase involved in cell wall biosynthesis
VSAESALQIVHIVADGSIGGGSTVVLGLIDELRRSRPCDVTLVSQPDSFLEREARRREIAFVGCNMFSSWADPTPPFRLRLALKGRHFNVAHLHGLRAAHHAIRWPIRPLLGAMVYTVHGLHQRQSHPWVRALANVVERQVIRIVDVPVFVSRSDEETARNWGLLGGRNALIIENGVDTGRPAAVVGLARDIDVAFVGRHSAEKGPVEAARLLAHFSTQGRRCVMAGGGPMLDEVLHLLHQLPGGEEVEHRGVLEPDDVLNLLARTRVVIAPSRWEGLPVLPIEAMVMGSAVVASRVSGNSEVVEDGSTGLLSPPGDLAEMARLVGRLLDDEQMRAAITERAEAAARIRFDRSRNWRRYLGLYDRIARAPEGQ